jgi:hypothetical protein
MNWEAIGAVGELVGAAGVVITLGFLAFQLRQNTTTIRVDGFRSVATMIHHPTTLIIQDPVVAEIHMRGNEDYESLKPIEKERYHYLMVQRLHAIEILDRYHTANMTDPWFADAGSQIAVRLTTKPGFRQWWDARGRVLFGPRFTDTIQSLVDVKDTRSERS